MKKISIVALLSIVAFIVFVIYYKEGLLAVNRSDKQTQIFIIKRGESVSSIIDNLHRQGLIRNKLPFFIHIKLKGIDGSIQAGDFRLSPSMNASEIAQTLTVGTLDKWVTVIEGMRVEEVANIFSREFGIPEVEFIRTAKEGYLFPDTYLVPKEATLGAVLEIFDRNFTKKFSPELKTKVERLNLNEIEVLTLASMVEREANNPKDMQKVASVMMRRLRLGMGLQVDATVQYALGYQALERTWWKKNLTLADLSLNSPYNTYKNAGLPPGPIASPGLSAIEAVVSADPNTPYLYYLTGTDGITRFARTLEEHNGNINKYLR